MTSQTEPWTVLRLLEWTTDYLSDHGATSARLDAEVLLAEARGCTRIDLYTAFDEVADERCRTAFRELVRRRADGTPVAYLVGRKEFYSLSFRVTPDVLIPRPETEQIVVSVIDLAKKPGSTGRALQIADIGTGSGVLAVCLAKHIADTSVTATDISAAALQIAKKNAYTHGVSDCIEFVESDLLAKVDPSTTFDFIVSNPPYVSESEYLELAPEVREHEPRTALVGGPTGTELISRLIHECTPRLRPGGWLILELSPMIAAQVESTLRGNAQLEGISVLLDTAKLPRIAMARRSVDA